MEAGHATAGDGAGFRTSNGWPLRVDPTGLPRFPDETWRHIVIGTANAGGHTREALERWKREGDSGFHPSWGPDEIGAATAKALRAAAEDEDVSSPLHLSVFDGHEALVAVNGRRAVVRVYLDYDGDKIVAASHPVRGDGVVQVSSGNLHARPLRPDEE